MNVFISYRRSDSKDVAARIADRLAQLREVDSVFLDVEAIGLGEHFPERLNAEIARADVVLAVIGPRWAGGRDEDGTLRIWQENDFVRREVAGALALEKRVIPCLVDEAGMPAADTLPEDIVGLAERNALELRHTSFRVDFETLADAILQRQRRGMEASASDIALGTVWRVLAGLVLAAVAAVIIAGAGFSFTDKPLETNLGGRVQLAVFLLLLLAAFQYGTYRYLRRYA